MIVVFTKRHSNLRGLEKAEMILSKNLRRGLEGLGKNLARSARSRMREDLGHAKKSLKIRVKGRGIDLDLFVYSTLIQAVVDARGLAPGKAFPPFGPNTRIYNWTARRMKQGFRRSVNSTSRRRVSHIASRRPRDPQLSRVNPVDKPKRAVGRARQVQKRRENLQRMAFLVARKIYENGIKASNWDRETLKANRKLIRRAVNNAIARAVNEINRG